MKKTVNGVEIDLGAEEVAAIESERASKLLPHAVKLKKHEILSAYSAVAAQIKSGYDDDEMKSWPKQEEQAKRYLSDSNAEGLTFLHSLAQLRGLTTQALAQRIVTKVAAYEQAFSFALGTRDQKLLQLAAVDLQAPDAIDQINAI